MIRLILFFSDSKIKHLVYLSSLKHTGMFSLSNKILISKLLSLARLYLKIQNLLPTANNNPSNCDYIFEKSIIYLKLLID